MRITTLMMEAGSNANPDAIEGLVKLGADVNAVDENGWTALMWAASLNDNPDVIERLVKLGADVNAVSRKGWTAYTLAACKNLRSDFVTLLLKLGADVLQELECSDEAMDAPRENESRIAMDMLRKIQREKSPLKKVK